MKSWTVMVYLAADNNLEYFAIEDFFEISAAGSDENINLLVKLDRPKKNKWYKDTRFGNWTICHRFYVEQGMEPEETNAVADWGDGQGGRELNTGHPDTLRDFIIWGVENYPAEKYAVVLWNHGSGWKSPFEEEPAMPFKEICIDETFGDFLTMKQVREAFEESGSYIDLIGFDACYMGMLEVASEMKNAGSVMVASEEFEYAAGWNFTGFLNALKASPVMDARQLGEAIVDAYANYIYYQPTLSAVDFTLLESFNTALDALLEEIMSLDNLWHAVIAARGDTQKFDGVDFFDLYGFLLNLSLQDIPPSLSLYLDNAMEEFGELVISNFAAPGYDAYGLSIYFPPHGGSVDPDYNGDFILFAGETLWKEFLFSFVDAPLYPAGPGDINGDGRIDISDVILCLRIAVGLDVTVRGVVYSYPDYSEEILELADIDENGEINISDVIKILRMAVGL